MTYQTWMREHDESQKPHFYARLCAFLLIAVLIVLAALYGLGVFAPPPSEPEALQPPVPVLSLLPSPDTLPAPQAEAPEVPETPEPAPLLSPPAAAPLKPATPPPPRLTIVIDDMGESMQATKALLALGYPVSFSIWPSSSHARATAEAAHDAGHEVMIHLPMEPVGHPEVRPGAGALLLGQSPEEIRRTVAAAVAAVPHAVGVNNHMGSRLTQDAASMEAVIDALLAQRHIRTLFVLDSLTHPKSRLYTLARQAGLRTYRRDVFLDVEENVSSVLQQLDRAARIARKHGQAVAIGHPLPETLEALALWQERRPAGVLIVPLANLD